MAAGRGLSSSLLCGRPKSLHISHSPSMQGTSSSSRIIHDSIEIWVWAVLSTEMKANLEGWGGVFSPNSDLLRFFALSAVWQAQIILLKQGWVRISTSQSQLKARWQMEKEAADGNVTSNHDSKPASVPLPKLEAHLQCAERLEESRNG